MAGFGGRIHFCLNASSYASKDGCLDSLTIFVIFVASIQKYPDQSPDTLVTKCLSWNSRLGKPPSPCNQSQLEDSNILLLHPDAGYLLIPTKGRRKASKISLFSSSLPHLYTYASHFLSNDPHCMGTWKDTRAWAAWPRQADEVQTRQGPCVTRQQLGLEHARGIAAGLQGPLPPVDCHTLAVILHRLRPSPGTQPCPAPYAVLMH